jgi:hypothetical protein
MPRWVRIWFRTPFLDRYAHQWMWFRGGWDVDPPEGLEPAVAARLMRSRPAPRRRSSRRRVGRPSRIVTFVIGLIDPAEGYLRRLPGPGRRPAHPRAQLPRVTGTTRTGVDSEGAEWSATLEAMWWSREYRQRERAAHEAAMRAAQHRWGAQARICAGDLVRDGVAVFRLGTGRVHARIVRFWRGDSVLDLPCVDSAGEPGGRSRTRLRRGQVADPELIAFYLVQQAARHD